MYNMTYKVINLLIWILKYEIFNFRNRLLNIWCILLFTLEIGIFISYIKYV